ncbi:hypothetical protein [Alkalibacterium kapii]|uniref:DUF4825 domain-containing protein n=1 Tax=Alkalibacterium kapii TaxID=426704 RepID=A0A511AV67_9LACT|nr:hypothetical protein [Alkalibacterium kapii]GEK92098.1 hypothetical protein AKA01nite_17200 [Alkalibacterium kapii]
MKKIAVLLISLLTLSLTLHFFTQKNEDVRSDTLKVLTLGDERNNSDDLFLYDSINLNQLTSTDFKESNYYNADSLFIYPEYFSKVSTKRYRESLQEISKRIPIIFLEASEFKAVLLFNTDLEYEKTVADSGYNEEIQSIYYLPDQDVSMFRLNSFNEEGKIELHSALKNILSSKTYTEYLKK